MNLKNEYKEYNSGFKTLLRGIAVVLLILFLCIRSCVSYATIRYISTTGNDVSGNGSIGNPYASLFKACSVSVSGDVVHVVTGSYVQNAQQVIVAPGVSIEGEGQTNTTILLTYSLAGSSGFNNAAIQLVSTTPNTNGNQSISNIRFNGNYTCFSGVLVRARGGVIIRNCTFSQFGIMAVSLYGKTGQATGQDPIAFADGNQILDCTFLDCNDRIIQQANSISAGSVAYAGQVNLLFQRDTTRNINKPQAHNGDLYCAVQGNNKSVTWDACIFEKPADEGAGFNFCIESWYDRGNCEIKNCTFIGGGNMIDIGYGGANKGAFSKSWKIHDNYFFNAALLSSAQNLPDVTAGGFVIGKSYIIKSVGTTNFVAIGAGSNTAGIIFTATGAGSGTGTGNASHPTESIAVQFEPSTNISLAAINTTIGDADIQNNHCNRIGTFLQVTLNNYASDFVKHLQIDHNICENMGYDGTKSTYSGMLMFTINNGVLMDSINVENNTFLSNTGLGCSKGIVILMPNVSGATISHFRFINNIADGCVSGYGYFVFRGTQACNLINCENNITFQNAFSNNPFVFTSPAAPMPTNFINQNNIKADPQFVSPTTDYHLKSTSPGISGGLNPPATYVGALQPGTTVLTLSWTPADLIFGTGLGAPQLNAVALDGVTVVPGTHVYSPAAGFVPSFVGTITVNDVFTPTDQVTYAVVSKSVSVNILPASVSFTVTNKVRTWTGANLFPTVVTNPAGVTYSITLNGVPGGQSAVGSYHYVIGPQSPNYTGSDTGTFTIVKDSTVIINAADKTVNYDATLQSIVATTTPSGVTGLEYKYNDVSVAGVTGPGVFDVAINLNNPNRYAPTIHKTLTILTNSAIIFISDSLFVYNGGPHPVTVTSSYSYTVTYNGSPTPPTNVTTGVQVIATINDGVHVGADTAIEVITRRDAILSWTKPVNSPFGTVASLTNLNPTSTVAGTFTFNVALGYQFLLGSNNLIATFTPTDAANNNGGTISTTIDIYAVNPVDVRNYYIQGPDGTYYIKQ